MDMKSNLSSVKGVGKAKQDLFQKLGIETIEDLLFHFPRTYEQIEKIRTIQGIEEGQVVTIEGCLTRRPSVKRVKNLNILSTYLKDQTSQIQLTWFNAPYMQKSLKVGVYYIIRGKVSIRNGQYALNQPQILTKQEYTSSLNKRIPVYSLCPGLTSAFIGKAISFALYNVEDYEDLISSKARTKYELLSRKKAFE